MVSGLLSASYRAIFIPFWLHGNHHGHRASRLDSAQYAALHHLSAAHRMCALLPDEQFQKAERSPSAIADASLLTVAQACALLGIAPSPRRRAGPAVLRLEPRRAGGGGRRHEPAAQRRGAPVAFTRIATLRVTMLSYDLGAQTRRKQALAICQRLLLPLAPGRGPVRRGATRLPKHATCSTAAPSAGASSTRCRTTRARTCAFNELGLSASMLTVDCATCAGHMRCAKRSSAALRTAVALEASAEQLELEQLDPVASPLLPQDLRPATDRRDHVHRRAKRTPSAARRGVGAALRDSSSEVAKFRRDLKSCFEQSQQATSCGDVPLVCVPILGRAIRVFGSWYALCSMCGRSRASRPRRASATRSAACAATLRCSRARPRRARCARRCPNRLRHRAASAARRSPRTARA